MKYAIIAVITLLFVSLTFNYVQKNSNDKLKAQISSFKEKTDTVLIKGEPDTVKVQRITKIYVEVPKDKSIELDTVINDHVISIKTDQSKLFINVECKRADLLIHQTDTLRIPVMVEIQLPPKPIAFLERKELWFSAGVLITYAILKAVSKN
jgi:hypothetical protein